MTILRKGTTKRWSDTNIYNGLVMLSGQLADDMDGDFAAQLHETLSNCSKALAAGGSDRANILSATIYMKDLAHMDALNAAWEDWLPLASAPARTTVRADMVNPKCLVEITLTGVQR